MTNPHIPEPDDASPDLDVPARAGGETPRADAMVAAPSPAYGVGMRDLLTADMWHRLAVAAQIPPSEIEAAFVGPASARVTALVAWLVPALWIVEAARTAADQLTGLVLVPGETPGACTMRADLATYDAVVTRLVTDGPPATIGGGR